jgi:hypothetical protein
VDIEKLRRRQRQALLRFRVLGVIVWLGAIAAGTYVLVAAVPRAAIIGWTLVFLGAGMLALRILVSVLGRRTQKAADAAATRSAGANSTP